MSAPMREVREVVREEPAMHAAILTALASGPRTVPEIAEAIGASGRETLVWVMGMRRYGLLREVGPAEDGFFRYGAVQSGGSQ